MAGSRDLTPTLRGHRCFDDLAHLYDRTRGGERRGREYAWEVAPWLESGGLVCDVGAGTGVVALGLVELGFRVVGVDLSARMLGFARDRLGPRMAVGDASALPVRAGSMDGACSVWVLHLVADPLAVVREVARALRPGARYAVVCGEPTNGPDEIWDVLGPMREELDRRGAMRERGDAPERIASLLEDAGFEVLEVTETARATFEETPGAVARELEERSFSYLDRVDEASWLDVVVPAIEALRAMPGPDRPRMRIGGRHGLVIGERRRTA